MKTWSRFVPLFLLVLINLCACGQKQTASAVGKSSDQEIMLEVWRAKSWFDIAPAVAEHGDDYAIEWEDPGMEAHVRLWLDKPEGEIRHSDVWNIQAISIQPYNSSPHDIALEQSSEGGESFTMESILMNKDAWILYGGKSIPVPESFADLQHFDSLQILCVEYKPTDDALIDISGFAQCPSLKAVHISNAKMEALMPFAEVTSLENLWLDGCGTLDLTPLENLPTLSALSLRGSNILSLEPLTTLPELEYLGIGNEATFPSLEPLTRSGVKFLDMGLSVSGRNKYDDQNYEPLTRMPALVYLNLTNHTVVDTALCKAILSGSPDLKYLNISYTPAAEEPSALDTGNLDAFVCISD